MAAPPKIGKPQPPRDGTPQAQPQKPAGQPARPPVLAIRGPGSLTVRSGRLP